MNDETVLPTEVLVDQPTEPTPQETEAETSPTDDWTVEQTEYVESTQETEDITLVEAVQTAATDLAHVNLFGSFLICGTLVGIFLLRNRHAN